MKIIAITQARIGSSRLPGKVLKIVDGVPLLQIHLERLLLSKKIDSIKVATTHEPEVSAIYNIADKLGIRYYSGSMDDVLDRYYKAAKGERADYIVRITSDCPLVDGAVVDELIEFAVTNKLEYASNALIPTFPDGMDVEIFTFKALESAWHQATTPSDREHVTPYIWRNSTFKGGRLFVSDNLESGGNFGHLRLTVDEAVDLELITLLISKLGTKASWRDYVAYLENHHDIRQINQHIHRNEGYLKSLKKD